SVHTRAARLMPTGTTAAMSSATCGDAMPPAHAAQLMPSADRKNSMKPPTVNTATIQHGPCASSVHARPRTLPPAGAMLARFCVRVHENPLLDTYTPMSANPNPCSATTCVPLLFMNHDPDVAGGIVMLPPGALAAFTHVE